MALYEELAPKVEDLYWTHSFAEMADELGCGTSTIQRAAKHAGLPKKTERNRVEHEHGVPIERVLYHVHHDAGLSENRMADALGVARSTLTKWFHDAGVEKRGRSEAERLKWEQMSPEERAAQVRAAHRAARKLPRFRTTYRGYEEIRHRRQSFKLHRLAAVAWFGWDAVIGKHVHHENGISWDNRQDNLQPLDPAEHQRLHADKNRDPATGRIG